MPGDTAGTEAIGTRAGFNAAVRRMQKTVAISREADSRNLGDILHEMGDDAPSGEDAALLLRILLVDKLGYTAVSANLASAAPEPEELADEFARWNGVDLVAAYHHPERGPLIANPKAPEALAAWGGLRRRELLVVYAGKRGSPAGQNCALAAKLALRLFEGRTAKVPPEILNGGFTDRGGARPGDAPRKAADGPPRMTPRYAVAVRNELFHNGNVEAWKRILASYKAAHPGLEVYVYYEGERIRDINSLFKWGKVRHGRAIEFAVAGDDIQNVAKLRRYLEQGASSRFEVFLRGPVNSVMKLF